MLRGNRRNPLSLHARAWTQYQPNSHLTPRIPTCRCCSAIERGPPLWPGAACLLCCTTTSCLVRWAAMLHAMECSCGRGGSMFAVLYNHVSSLTRQVFCSLSTVLPSQTQCAVCAAAPLLTPGCLPPCPPLPAPPTNRSPQQRMPGRRCCCSSHTVQSVWPWARRCCAWGLQRLCTLCSWQGCRAPCSSLQTP